MSQRDLEDLSSWLSDVIRQTNEDSDILTRYGAEGDSDLARFSKGKEYAFRVVRAYINARLDNL